MNGLICSNIPNEKIAEKYRRIFRIFWSGIKIPKNYRGKLPMATNIYLTVERILFIWDQRHRKRKINFELPAELVKTRHPPSRAVKDIPALKNKLEALKVKRSHSGFLKAMADEYDVIVNEFDRAKPEDMSILNSRRKFKAYLFKNIVPNLKSFELTSKLKAGTLWSKFDMWRRRLLMKCPS